MSSLGSLKEYNDALSTFPLFVGGYLGVLQQLVHVYQILVNRLLFCFAFISGTIFREHLDINMNGYANKNHNIFMYTIRCWSDCLWRWLDPFPDLLLPIQRRSRKLGFSRGQYCWSKYRLQYLFAIDIIFQQYSITNKNKNKKLHKM